MLSFLTGLPVKTFLERKFHLMTIAQLVLTIIIVIASIFLICVVLLQSGKSSGVAGALSGGSDTFLSNHKKNTWDAKLARITKWVSFVFYGGGSV